MFADLRGDALAAAGRSGDARSAYEAALAKLDPKSQYRNYVQVKLDALGGTAKTTAAAAPTATAPPAPIASETPTQKAPAQAGAAK